MQITHTYKNIKMHRVLTVIDLLLKSSHYTILRETVVAVYPRYSKTEILLADEISCDTCRLWLKDSGQSVDKDVFRYGRDDFITAYEEAAKRIWH